MRFIWMCLVALTAAGCATIVEGTSQAIFVDTPGYAGAQCTLTSREIGTRKVTTPATVELPRSRHDIAVNCAKGCYKGQGLIASNLEGTTAGNILLGGVIGAGVDAASGAMNSYNASNQIALVAEPGCTS